VPAASPLRLRFDKVARALVERVRGAVRDLVPESKTLIFTVTAPIRLPSKTAAALEDKIRDALARRPARLEIKDSIHGNHVRIWLVPSTASRAPKVMGFVHNPETDPKLVLAMARSTGA
jgi:hypothetical protein